MMIDQTIKYSLAFGVLCAMIILSFSSAWDALAFFVGTAWACVNLFFISSLAKAYLISKQQLTMLLILLVKFPLLYGIGYLLLSVSLWNAWFLAAGLPVIFLVAFIIALSQLKEKPV